MKIKYKVRVIIEEEVIDIGWGKGSGKYETILDKLVDIITWSDREPDSDCPKCSSKCEGKTRTWIETNDDGMGALYRQSGTSVSYVLGSMAEHIIFRGINF